MRKYRLQISLLIGLFAALVLIEYYAPQPLDWTPTFAKDDKIPYGNYVLFNMLPDIFPEQDVLVNDYTLYESDTLLDGHANLIFIARSYHQMDSIDNELLLQHVGKGGNAFIAAEFFAFKLRDTLGFQTNFDHVIFSDSTHMAFNFVNPQLRSDSDFIFPRSYFHPYCSSLDTLRSTVLGEIDSAKTNFLKIPFGKGNFFIHTQPALFTNFNMLHGSNHEYVEKALSYLPLRPTIWDEYHHHLGRNKQTALRFIFKEKALYAAWLTILVGLLLFVFFEGKRVQRIIPVVAPPRNASLEFITTIGRLYFHRSDNKDIALKKFSYLAEFLRNKYFIEIADTKLPDSQDVAQKLGMKSQFVEKVFGQYNFIRDKKAISAEELIEFNKIVEEFYRRLSA